MKSGKRTTRSLIATVLISCGALAYLFLVFLPTQRSIAELRDQLDEKRRFVLEVDGQHAAIGSLQKELAEVRTLIDESRTRQSASVSTLLTNMTQIAAESQVQMKKISPEQPRDRNALREHPLQVIVTGDFHQLFRFLEELEAWTGNAWTTRLELEGNSETSPNLTCKLNLTVFNDLPDSSD